MLSKQDVQKLQLSLNLKIILKNRLSAATQMLVCKGRFIIIDHEVMSTVLSPKCFLGDHLCVPGYVYFQEQGRIE